MNSNRMRRAGILLTLLLLTPWLQAAPVMVSGDWLEPRLGQPGLVIVDMSVGDAQYQRFHLPGAVRLPYQALVQKRRDGVSVRIDDGRLAAILGILGITPEDHVVIYDDMGGLNAARLFWELERIGHRQVSVLDGGLVRWILDRRPVDNRQVQRPRVRYALPGDGRDNDAALEQVRAAMEAGEPLLLDVRTGQEYRGKPRVARSGHVPGARFWPWDQAVDFDAGFVARPADELRAGLAAAGAEKGRPVIAYCRTGHRAARAYLTLRRLGFDQVKVYDGSMAEWSRNPDLPMKQGMEP